MNHMTVPQGAQKVKYVISITEASPEVEIVFEAAVGTSPGGEAADAAVQAGADAMIAYLEAEFPNKTVNAGRTYEGFLQGDTWPAP